MSDPQDSILAALPAPNKTSAPPLKTPAKPEEPSDLLDWRKLIAAASANAEKEVPPEGPEPHTQAESEVDRIRQSILD